MRVPWAPYRDRIDAAASAASALKTHRDPALSSHVFQSIARATGRMSVWLDSHSGVSRSGALLSASADHSCAAALLPGRAAGAVCLKGCGDGVRDYATSGAAPAGAALHLHGCHRSSAWSSLARASHALLVPLTLGWLGPAAAGDESASRRKAMANARWRGCLRTKPHRR